MEYKVFIAEYTYSYGDDTPILGFFYSLESAKRACEREQFNNPDGPNNESETLIWKRADPIHFGSSVSSGEIWKAEFENITYVVYQIKIEE